VENSACHVQRVLILGFGHFLRGWNFATDFIVLCIITSYLLTKYNSIATVSIIKLSCVVTRQFSRPCKCNFQIRVIVNVGCAALHSQATCSFVFKSHHTDNACLRFPQKEFFRTWKMCPPINEIVCASSVNQSICICRWHLSISLAIISLGYGSEVVVPKIDHPGLET
jgi:hypothetical protein